MKLKLFTKVFVSLFLISCTMALPEKHFKLGEEYFQQGQYQRAVEEYKKVVSIEPNSKLALTALDRVADVQRSYLKNPAEAIVALHQRFQLSKEDADKINSLRQTAIIYKDDLEDPSQAADEYLRLYNEFGLEQLKGDELLLELASSLSEAGRYSAASEKYHEFLLKYPGHQKGPSAMLAFANNLLFSGNLEKAEEAFQGILDQFQGRPSYKGLIAESYFGMGNLYEEKDDLKKALEFYETSLVDYPNRSVINLKIKAVRKRKKERSL